MARQFKDAISTVGGISTSANITTTGNGNHNIGSTDNRFNSIIGTNIYTYDANAQHYASLRTTTVGTADTQGVGRLVAGNNVASGTAGNAKGQVLLYGTNTGYTALTPGNNTTSNVTIELPSASGKLMMAKQGTDDYWGLVLPTGVDTSWIRTAKSGLLPYDKGITSSSIGSTSWPFNNVCGRNFGVYDTSGQTYGAMRIQTAGTTEAQGETRLTLGNSLATGVANNSYGRVCLYGKGAGHTYITPGNNGDSGITLTLPSSGGTLARTADIDSKVANYLPLAGGTMTGSIKVGGLTGTWVSAAKDSKAVISSTQSAGAFHPMYTFKTNNGSIILAGYQSSLQVAYLTKANVDSGTNTVSYVGMLMTENGGAEWPGTVKASRVEITGNGPQLMLKANQSNNYATMQFLNTSGASMGYIGMSAVNGGLYRWKSDASMARAIIDEDTWSWALPSPTSGAYWQGIMKVNGDGVTEAGKYLDFHYSNTTTNDYSVRLSCYNDNRIDVSLPASSGTLALTSQIPNMGLFRTNGGQDFIGRDKRCMVATTSELVINYGPDFTQTRFHGNIHVDGYAKINGTPVSVQSGAPSCGGVWIQI